MVFIQSSLYKMLYAWHFSKCITNINSLNLCVNLIRWTPLSISSFLQMRKLKYKEEKPCLKSHWEKSVPSPFDSRVRLVVTICLPVSPLSFWQSLKLCFGFPSPLPHGFILWTLWCFSWQAFPLASFSGPYFIQF